MTKIPIIGRKSRIPECHPDRKHEGRGLCAQCYAKGTWREPVFCGGCHKPKNYMLRNGLCSWCDKKSRNDDPDRLGHKIRNKTYRDNNPGMAARKHLLKRYGLTPAKFEALKVAQFNKCKICLKPFDGTPFVDHNHETGQTRGLLCHKCNAGIGFLQEDEFILARSVAYLRQYGAAPTSWPETRFVDLLQ